jgi:alpha-N-arabinofuranosidase
MNMNRRSFLAMAATGIAARAQRPAAKVEVVPDEEIGRISPLIYGQFAEHVGNLIYDGIWVGPDSRIPNKRGYRLDTLEALKKIRPGVVRWPGGCFADAYDWTDGVGPTRVPRRNLWWAREEPNTFGTDEFLGWCRELGAQPYLSVNVGSGDVGQALNWLEYCNGAGNSKYAAMRARNGHPEPYGVKFWGIGNENWGCGGAFTPSEYAQRFRQYSMYFKRFGMSDETELVAVGHTAEWNRDVLRNFGMGLPYLNHFSLHHYFRRGSAATFSEDEYNALMSDTAPFEAEIKTAIATIKEIEPVRAKMPVFGAMKLRPVGIIFDEWGVWDSESTLENGFRQNGPLREALFAASCLNLFHRYCDRITMTNIAQSVNVLQSLILTESSSMVLTPTYHVYQMYLQHQNALSVRTEVQGSAPLSISASKANGSLFLTAVNTSQTENIDLDVTIRGARLGKAESASLTAPSVRTQNTFEHPHTVTPGPARVSAVSSGLHLTIPSKSVQTVSVKLI